PDGGAPATCASPADVLPSERSTIPGLLSSMGARVEGAAAAVAVEAGADVGGENMGGIQLGNPELGFLAGSRSKLRTLMGRSPSSDDTPPSPEPSAVEIAPRRRGKPAGAYGTGDDNPRTSLGTRTRYSSTGTPSGSTKTLNCRRLRTPATPPSISYTAAGWCWCPFPMELPGPSRLRLTGACSVETPTGMSWGRRFRAQFDPGEEGEFGVVAGFLRGVGEEGPSVGDKLESGPPNADLQASPSSVL
ncbi:hypothetical protein Dimus_028923, partial [Dionaea muscipula]